MNYSKERERAFLAYCLDHADDMIKRPALFRKNIKVHEDIISVDIEKLKRWCEDAEANKMGG